MSPRHPDGDPRRALGHVFPEHTSSYDERDLALYALGVGAEDLRFVYEKADGFAALPTFAVVPALRDGLARLARGENAPGLSYGPEQVLHGEQLTELRRPLPPRARLVHRARIEELWDKGRMAVVVTAIETSDDDGPLAYHEVTTFVRGAGGWGGERGPARAEHAPPDRAPDAVREQAVGRTQALLYRLSGDTNPLHVDPAAAKAFGFERPILHGLCTFGFAARHVIEAMAGGDPRRLRSIRVRFSDVVYPGDTLVTEMWDEGEGRIVFRTKARGRTVLSNAMVQLTA